MQRKLALAIAVYLSLASLVLAQGASQTDHPWARFRPGSWSRLVIVNKSGGEPVFVTWMLMSVTAKEAIVKTEVRRGPEIVMTDMIDFPIPYSRKRPDSVSQTVLRLKGREMKCDVLRYHAESRVAWHCPDVPGFAALDETPVTTTTLVDFESK